MQPNGVIGRWAVDPSWHNHLLCGCWWTTTKKMHFYCMTLFNFNTKLFVLRTKKNLQKNTKWKRGLSDGKTDEGFVWESSSVSWMKGKYELSGTPLLCSKRCPKLIFFFRTSISPQSQYKMWNKCEKYEITFFFFQEKNNPLQPSK